MSDNTNKPTTQTISAEGFKDIGNPIEHKKKRLPVKYFTRNIVNDLGDGRPDLIQITAITMQYDVEITKEFPVDKAQSVYMFINDWVYAELSKKGYEADNIELVNDSDEKELWIAELREMGYKAAIRNDFFRDEHEGLRENAAYYYFQDGTLEAGDKVVIGSYRNPDDYKDIELTHSFTNKDGYAKWGFKYIEDSL